MIESIFHNLEQETGQFQKASGIGCIAVCGKCCTYPDIDASLLEFSPWAFHLFLNGEAEQILLTLEESQSLTCLIYKPLPGIDQGTCSDYKYKGLICRLFASAASTDKYGKLRLATCKIIKEGQAETYNAYRPFPNSDKKSL